MWLDLMSKELIWKTMEKVGVNFKEFTKRDATAVKNQIVYFGSKTIGIKRTS